MYKYLKMLKNTYYYLREYVNYTKVCGRCTYFVCSSVQIFLFFTLDMIDIL